MEPSEVVGIRARLAKCAEDPRGITLPPRWVDELTEFYMKGAWTISEFNPNPHDGWIAMKAAYRGPALREDVFKELA